MNIISQFLCILIIFLVGCVSTQSANQPSGAAMPDRYSLPLVEEKFPKPAEGTIYSARVKNLYQDSRARSIGDIVTVNIVETSSGTKSAETTTSRDSSLTGGISSLFGMESWLKGEDGRHTPSLTSMQTNIEKSFEGKGETTRNSTVKATISARVINVTMDGNLIIRGYREIRVNNETQHIILSGIVRPEDISKDNSIVSTQIADARIEYTGSGALSVKQQPGWLANAIDVVWPF